MSKNSLSENIKTEQQAEVFKNALNSINQNASAPIEQLKDAFRRLQQLYIHECRNNPNVALNEQLFIDEWDRDAGIADENYIRSSGKCPMCNHDLSKQ